MKSQTINKTVTITKKYKAKISAVYSAFSSVKARSEWAVPKGDAIKYSKANFKVNGKDEFRCGTPPKLDFKGTVHYLSIEKNHRIISTETLIHSNQILSVALLTTDFSESEGKTTVKIIAQVASLKGHDMSLGYKSGWTSVLKNLTEYLEKE